MNSFPARLALVASFVASVLSGCSSSTPGASSTLSADADRYAAYSQTYTVPYVGTPTFTNLTSTLKVQAQVNGGAVSSFTVDTGSVGVVVPASEVPNIPAGSPAGTLRYSSSGLTLTGVWVTMPVVFPQATPSSGSGAATATLPVLAVTSGTCSGSGVNSANCTGAIPHMLGVGYGRGTTVETSPMYNPFLTLAEMKAGTMRRGYSITRTGVVLGITSVSSSGYAMEPLVSAGTPAAGNNNDWVTVGGGFKVGSASAVTGKVLLDTGLLNMIVENSSLPQSGTLSSGTQMTVTIAKQSYSFTLGDSGVQTPTSASYASSASGTFLNTGLRALGHFDYLFDADGGYMGLRAQ